MMFLIRVTSHQSKLTEDMLKFDNLDDASDLEEEEEQVQETPAPTQEAQQPENNNTTQNDRICKLCLTDRADCVLVPCGHQYACMPCYKQFIGIEDDSDIPREAPKCPWCRGSVMMWVQARFD